MRWPWRGSSPVVSVSRMIWRIQESGSGSRVSETVRVTVS
jgi:hypothetical protein